MKTKLLIFILSLFSFLPALAKEDSSHSLTKTAQEAIFQRTRAINNELFEYQIQGNESIGTILHELGIGPLWGPNGYVKKIENLNQENLKLWGQRLKKGQWLKIPYPLESVMAYFNNTNEQKPDAFESPPVPPTTLDENIQIIDAHSFKIRITGQQSLSDVLQGLKISPLWGPLGMVAKTQTINRALLDSWGGKLRKGEWIVIPRAYSVPSNDPPAPIAPIRSIDPIPSVAPVPVTDPLPSITPAPSSDPLPSIAPAPSSDPLPSIAPIVPANPIPSIARVPETDPLPSSDPTPAIVNRLIVQPAPIQEEIKSNDQEPLIAEEHIDSSRDIPARTIFLRMEKVSDAKTYQIQVKDRNKTWADPYVLTTSREKIRFRATPGEYLLRTRSIDQNGKGGAWLPWVEFKVPFKYILSVSPPSGTVIEPKGNRDERITFEWPQIKGSIAYRFKLFDQDRNLIKNVVTKENWLLQVVEINKSYSWSVQPLKTIDDPVEDMPSPHLLTISSPNPELIPVRLKLAGSAVAEEYQFELVKLRDDSETSEPTIYDSKQPEFMGRLSPGQYELRARTKFEDKTSSGWSSPHLFSVPIPPPAPRSATNNATVESTDDIQSEVELKWNESKWADRYQVVITDKDGQIQSSKVVKGSRMIASLPHDNSYEWTVVALAPKEPEKPPEELIQKDNVELHQFQINKYIPLQLGSSEEPSQIYGWSRFLFSQASYKNQNYDNNNRVQQNLFASTGEIGAGYWHRKSSVGLLALTALSGINIDGTTLLYQQHSLLLGYRYKLSGQKRLRFWLGPSLKETPEVQVNGETLSTELKKISTYGPYFLTAFHDAFNDRLGYQASAGAFQGMQGLQTPNGLSQSNYLSYFWSLSLSYRSSDWLSVLGGYTFQEDRAGYKSTDGRSNDITLSGSYFSLNLIFGLVDAQK